MQCGKGNGMKRSGILRSCAALAMCVLVLAGCGKSTAREVEIRNSGEAIQWKYTDEEQWNDLVALADLRGAAGASGADGQNGADGANGPAGLNGADGKNGADGQNGQDGRTVEVRKTDDSVQWRYEGGQWQELVALSDITGPAGRNGSDGQNGQNGANGKTPEFQVAEGVLQWRYVGDEVWLNLYDLSQLKGADGQNGKDGRDGVDGKDGQDGRDGVDGKDGQDGQNGRDGVDGKDGTDGTCPGYFYASGTTSNSMGDRLLPFSERVNGGGLVSYDEQSGVITLKKGHIYNVCFNGSIWLSTNSNNSKETDIHIWLNDGYQEWEAQYSTYIRESNASDKLVLMQLPMVYNRFYVADSQDIALKYTLVKGNSYTYIDYFHYNLTITALN